jgi:hypothetical protein
VGYPCTSLGQQLQLVLRELRAMRQDGAWAQQACCIKRSGAATWSSRGRVCLCCQGNVIQ